MNTVVSTGDFIKASRKELTELKITNRSVLRTALIKKHGSLTEAAVNLELSYSRLSAAISGRESLLYVIATIQADLGLTDSQVLTLWPLLRRWPRKSRVVS